MAILRVKTCRIACCIGEEANSYTQVPRRRDIMIGSEKQKIKCDHQWNILFDTHACMGMVRVKLSTYLSQKRHSSKYKGLCNTYLLQVLVKRHQDTIVPSIFMCWKIAIFFGQPGPVCG